MEAPAVATSDGVLPNVKAEVRAMLAGFFAVIDGCVIEPGTDGSRLCAQRKGRRLTMFFRVEFDPNSTMSYCTYL